MPPVIKSGHIYLGIDPGASGGLAALNGRIVSAVAMPVTERDVWDWVGIYRQDRMLGGGKLGLGNCTATIEWISPAIFGAAKGGMSKLYGNYMMLRAFLVAADIPFDDPKPSTWQRALGIPVRKRSWSRTEWKNVLKAKAQQFFPTEKVTLATADALLIALYCQRRQEGTL